MFDNESFEDAFPQPINREELEASLRSLHHSVHRLISVIRENAGVLDNTEEILNKLPLLDFYNDDLLRNIDSLREQ